MGVLDDAIRAHIELKRQHGASEQDLEREQEEALGPARREAPAEPAEDPLEAPAADGPVGEDADGETGLVSEVPAAEMPTEMIAAADMTELDPPEAEPFGTEAGPVEAAEEDDFEDGDEVPLADDRAPIEPEPRRGETPTRGFAAISEEDDELPTPAPPPASFRDDDPFADDEPFADEEPVEPVRRAEATSGEGGPETDDVLEETPEFLQETPEHDRLWFEQKPPRDFDFDD